MSYFLSGLTKLKEQASNIQSMAKNIIVQQNQAEQNVDDEEILDAIIDDNNSQPPSMAIKEQADDFFNQFIPSLQQKAKTGASISANNSEKSVNSDKQAINESKQPKTIKSEVRKTESIKVENNKNGNNSAGGNTIAKSNENERKNSKLANGGYQEEEFEERIRAYQNILQENEATIDQFRIKVVGLEKQLLDLKPLSQQEQNEDQSQQLESLQEVIQKERLLNKEKDKELNMIRSQYEVILRRNYNYEKDYERQISEIESILSNLVQSQIENEQKQQVQPSTTKGKKGKKQNQNQQEPAQTQALDQDKLEQLSNTMNEILKLLKPVRNFQREEQLEKTIQEMENNNVILRELNLKISDKLLSLEQTYTGKIAKKIQELEVVYEVRQKELEAQNGKLRELMEKEFQEKLSEKLQSLNEKIDQQEKDFSQQSLTQEKLSREKIQALEDSFKYESIQMKKHIIDQVYSSLQQSLIKVFEIQEKLVQTGETEDLVHNYSLLIKENFKGSLQLDAVNIQAMKECWDQVNERFKPLSLGKHQKQSVKDSQQWLNQRFGNLPKTKKKEDDFRESDLYKLYETQLQLVLQLNLYIQDQSTQQQDLTAKKDTLQSQFTKLQKECNDMMTKNKEIPKLKEKQDQLVQEKEVIQTQLQEVLQQKLDFQMKVEEGRNKTEMLVVENATLKEKVATLDEEIKRLRKQIKQLQGQADLQEDFKLQHEKAQQEIKWQETQIKSKESEIEEARKTVTLLQRAIQQQQDEYEQNLRLKEREQAEDKALLQTLQLQNNETKEKIREIVEIQNQLQSKEEQNIDLQGKLQKSEIENLELKKYSQELVEKVKKDSEQSEFMVDRRMINKFLVNYVNQNSTKEVKFQMLDAMSKILGFTMEEKQQLGLIKKPSLLEAAGDAQTNQRGIGEKLINFFLQDDDDE